MILNLKEKRDWIYYMVWIIVNRKGTVMHKPNKQFIVFPTPHEAMKYIEEHCGGSIYLSPARLYKRWKFI